MRKGTKLNPWSTEEVLYLIDHAGRCPKREICQHLKRSSKSVERKASWLRERGYSVELRCYSPKLATCPACGCLRSTVDHRSGICEPCRRREQLATIQGRIAELYPLLSPTDRDLYEMTEAETASQIEPAPMPPNTQGMSRYAAAKTREGYEIDLERWTAANLQRQIKAAQKRKERIEKKCKKSKSMGLYVNPGSGA